MLQNHTSERGLEAEKYVAAWLKERGWILESQLTGQTGKADIVARQGGQLYVVEVKTLSEGRPDRVIPVLSQAVLQAQAYAAQKANAIPLAVAYVEHASPSLLRQVAHFAEHYVHHSGVGILSANGFSL